jgi:hypothetical protein
LNFLDRFSKNTQNFMKILSEGAELFHAGGRTDGQTDRQDEAIVAFHNFANAQKKSGGVNQITTGFIGNL